MTEKWEGPWNVEASFIMKERGISEDRARTIVIMRWMLHGDLLPLVAAIEDGHTLDKSVLKLLVRMILNGRLIVKPKGRGRPRSLGADLRDMVAADWYESPSFADLSSEERYDLIAGVFSTSEKSVRRAVTAARKRRQSR
jgi:hypothetical protein